MKSSKNNINKESSKEMASHSLLQELENFKTESKLKSSKVVKNSKKNKISNTQNILNDINEINNNNFSNNINTEEKEANNLNINKLTKARKRLDLENLMGCDQFAENYILEGSNNCNNDELDLLYSKPFDDRIFLKDENLFFIYDNSYKSKFLTKEDIKKMKKEECKLSFGKDPYEVYEQIYECKISPHDKNSIEFYNSLNNFNIFRSRDPNYMNLRLNERNIENMDYFNMINNNNFYFYYDQEQNYGYLQTESLNSTRETSKNNQKSPTIIINQKDMLINEKIFKNELDEIKENENNINNICIGKKRKNGN